MAVGISEGKLVRNCYFDASGSPQTAIIQCTGRSNSFLLHAYKILATVTESTK